MFDSEPILSHLADVAERANVVPGQSGVQRAFGGAYSQAEDFPDRDPRLILPMHSGHVEGAVIPVEQPIPRIDVFGMNAHALYGGEPLASLQLVVAEQGFRPRTPATGPSCRGGPKSNVSGSNG